MYPRYSSGFDQSPLLSELFISPKYIGKMEDTKSESISEKIFELSFGEYHLSAFLSVSGNILSNDLVNTTKQMFTLSSTRIISLSNFVLYAGFFRYASSP